MLTGRNPGWVCVLQPLSHGGVFWSSMDPQSLINISVDRILGLQTDNRPFATVGTQEPSQERGDNLQSLVRSQRRSCCGRRQRVLGGKTPLLLFLWAAANWLGPITSDPLILYVLLSHTSRIHVLAHYMHKSSYMC